MNRYELANAIIEAIGARSYLQVGSHLSEQVVCASARSVMDVSEVPALLAYDVILVDGAMSHGQARGAILGALDRVSPHGVVLVSNVSPAAPWMAEWPPSAGVQLGEAWRAWAEVRVGLACVTVASPEDHGVGVAVLGLPIPEAATRGPVFEPLDYTTMDARRAMILGLVTEAEVLVLVASSVAVVPRSAVVAMAPEATPEATTPAFTPPDGPAEPAPLAYPSTPSPKRKRRP